MPEVISYEQDYFIGTTKGEVVLENAICFGALNNPQRVIEWGDWDEDDEPDVYDMTYIRQPYYPKWVKPAAVDVWLDYLEWKCKAAVLEVDRKEQWVKFKVKRVPQQETFLAMTLLRSIGEQPDAVMFFYNCVIRGIPQDDAFALCYLALQTTHSSNVFVFGSLNGRSIHIPIEPRGWDKDTLDNWRAYPAPHRKEWKGDRVHKSYYKYLGYSKIQAYTNKHVAGFGGVAPGKWVSETMGTMVDFTKDDAIAIINIGKILGALYDTGKKKESKRASSRAYHIR